MKISTTKKYLETPKKSSRDASPNHMMINGRLMGEKACDNILLQIPKPIPAKIANKGKPKPKPTITGKDSSWLEFSSESSSSDNLSSISQQELFIGTSDSNNCLTSTSISEIAHLDPIKSASDTQPESGPLVKKSLSHGDLMNNCYSKKPNMTIKTCLWQPTSMSSNNNTSQETYLDENVKSGNPDELFGTNDKLNSEFPTLKSLVAEQEQFNWFSNTYLRTGTENISEVDLKLKKSLSYNDLLLNELCDFEELNNYQIKKASSMIALNRKSSSELQNSAESDPQFVNYLSGADPCIRRQRGTRTTPKTGTNFLEEEITFTEKEYKEWLRSKNWLQFYYRHISPPSRSSSDDNYCAERNLMELPEPPSRAISKRTKISACNGWTGGMAVCCIVTLFLWFSI